MPTPQEIADNLLRFGERSPFYAQAEEDARRAASDAVAAQRRFEIEQTGNDPFTQAPETMQMVYLDFLRRARASRSLPQTMREADLAGTFTADDEEVETGVLGGVGKGIEAGAMRVGSIVASPFLSEEESAANFAAANKRGSEVEGAPAEIAATIAQTGTEMAPLIAASVVTGGAALPALGAGGARAVALGTASTGAGLQSGVPEYFERRGQGMDPEQALKVAGAKGLATAGVTALFGLRGVEALANPVARKGVRSFLGALTKGAATEGVEEATDEVLQAFADKAIAGDNVTLGDFVERAAKAGALGALFGGAGEVVAEGRDRLTRPSLNVSAPPPAAPVPSRGPKPQASAVGPQNVGVAVRNVLSGAIQPEALAPQARVLVAQTLRQQIPQGGVVPPPIQGLLDRLEQGRQNAPSSPTPMGGPGAVGAPQPALAAVPAPAQPNAVPNVPPAVAGAPRAAQPGPIQPAAPTVAPAPVAPGSVAAPVPGATQPDPQGVEPSGDVIAKLQELGVAQENARKAIEKTKTSAKVPLKELMALDAAEHAVPRETPRPKVGPKEINQLADRGVRTGPAPEDPIERAQWEQRLSVDTAEGLLKSLGDNPTGLMKQAQSKLQRALGKTPAVERRLQSAGFTPKEALAEREAAPKVDVQAPTERIVKPKPQEKSDVVPAQTTPAPGPGPERGTGSDSRRTAGTDPGPALERAAPEVQREPADRVEPARSEPAGDRGGETVRPVETAEADARSARPRKDDRGSDGIAERSSDAAGAPGGKPVGGRREGDIPQQRVARPPFDISDDPASPGFVSRVRERVAEAISKKRKTGGTELRPGVDPIVEALGDEPTVDTNIKASAAVRKRVVDEKAVVNGKETKLYESPNSWGKPINEYVELHRKHGKVLRANARAKQANSILERREMQLSELPADAPADARNRAVAARDKARDEYEKARSKATTARSGKNPPSNQELARLTQLSNSIRGYFAEGLAKQAADVVRAAPSDQRVAVAARIEAQIETGELTELVSEELVDPATLSGVNSRAFLADVDGKFALVVPHPKKPGEYVTLDRTGERSVDEPFVTDQLGELLDLLSARDLAAPTRVAEAAAEGLSTGLAEREIRAGTRGTAERVDVNSPPQEWETAETYLSRVLLTDTNGDVDMSGKRREKSVDAAALDSRIESSFGEAGKKTLAEFVRVKAIEKRGDRYVSLPMSMFYRRNGPAMSGAVGTGTADDVISEQKQIEKAAVLFDLDVRTGMRHGVEIPKGAGGVFDMNARSIALGQFDLGTFFHELFHDITISEIGKRSTPMRIVQTQLVKAATDNKQPALMSEGAAELGRIYVQDPAQAKRLYPDATAWIENLLRDRGLKDRVDSVVGEHQKWMAASPEQRRKAAIVAKDELARREKATPIGNPLTRLKTFLSTQLFDRVANLRAVSRQLPPPKDSYDDAYEAKMLESGWAKAGADTFINGFILDPRTGQRAIGFGDVMDRAKDLGMTPEQFTEWQTYMAAMTIMDKSPRIRRRIFKKLGIDERKHGAWAIEGDILPDPFDSIDEIIAANQEMDLQWEAKVDQNKLLGKPAPPKPVHYKVKDPSPGTGDNAPTNFTEQQLEDFGRIISQHNTRSDFHRLAETHMEAVNNMDDWRVKNGLLTHADRKRHRTHAYHVPLRTEAEGGQRVKVKGSGGAEILAPYEQLWDKVRTDHFYLYSQAAPRAWLRYITGVRAERNRRGEQHQESEFPLAKMASFTSLDEAIRNYASIQAKIKRTGQESPVVDEYVVVTLDGPTIGALKQAGLLGQVKDTKSLIGTHIAYRVEDPAIRSSLGEPTIPWTPALHWIFRGPASVLRKLTTVLNPEFWVKTVIRDTYQATLQTAQGRNPVRFLASEGKGVMDAYTNASNLASDRAKTDPIYAAFVQSGVTSSSLLADAGNVTTVLGSHDLARALSMMGAAKPKFGWLRSLASPLNRVADTVEGFNRAAEFRRAISDGLAKQGVSSLTKLSDRQARALLISAARAAQEVTVNFRRMGAFTPIRILNEMVPFFNATIQGSIRGAKTLAFQQRFPGESAGARVVNGLTVYTLLALPVLLQHLMLDDPEDRDQYAELPDGERMLFYHFPAGKDAAGNTKFVRVPKPQGPFTGMIAAMEKMMADDPRTWSEIGHDSFEQVAPQSFIPTSLQLGVELFGGGRLGATAGRGMTPYRLQGVEGDAQDAPWLSPTSYHVADALQAMGWSSMSPLQAENLLRGYTGGLGWTVLDVPPTAQDLVGKHDRASYDAGSYPIARLLVTRDPGFASRSITRVYDLLDVLNNQRKTYEQEVRRAELGQQTPDEAVKNILGRPLTGFGKQADEELADFRAQMGKARTLWESINRDTTLDPIQRRIEMDKLVDQMVDASRLVYSTMTKLAADEQIDLKIPRR